MSQAPGTGPQLWYRKPAGEFLEALPLGNGRLGAMLYGGVGSETIEVNADTLWSGTPGKRDVSLAAGHLPALRAAVLSSKDYLEADRVAAQMQGRFTEAYQPLTTVCLDFGAGSDATSYRRTLDLGDAIHTVAYNVGGVEFVR
jgi:alpha-L-fucosidase 2